MAPSPSLSIMAKSIRIIIRYSAIFDTAGKSAAGAPEERERPGNVYHVELNTFRHDLGNFGKPKFAGHTVVSGVHV
jgi:hypothetical protein